MDNKKSFILYLDQKELFDSLPDEIAGKLIKHIFSYVNCEDPVSDDLIITVAFASIKQSLKRDLKKWESSIAQRSEAGKISAARRAVSGSVSGSVSVSVSDSVSKKTNTCQPPGMTLIKNNDVQDVFDYWIKVMGKNALTSKLTTKRKKAINDRLKDKYTVTMIFRAIEGCFDDPFSMGVNERNKPFNDIELICRTGEKLESFYNTSLGNNRQVVVKEFF